MNPENQTSATQYHPPMTGLEAHMEEEIANEAHTPFEPLEQAQRMREGDSAKTAEAGPEDDRIEELMHLGR